MVDGPDAGYRPRSIAHFRVWIDGEELGASSVSAFAGVVGPDTAGEDTQTVVIVRAVQGDRRLFQWFEAARHGKSVARVVDIALLAGPGGEAVDRWQLVGARPVRWSGPEFDALSQGIASESLTVRYDEIRWAGSP